MSSRSKSRYSAKGRQRSQKRSQKGGDAASWQLNNLGDGWTQFMNTFSLQSGQNSSVNQSNAIVQNHSKMMKGGKRRRMRQSKSRSRGKTGGYFGAVLEQAAVPLALLGMQQYYGKKYTRKNRGQNKSFKRRH